MNKLSCRCLSVHLALASLAGGAVASDIAVSFAAPTGDRWMYPFATGNGSELRAPAFATPGQDAFDDRDSEFLAFWDTDGALQIPSGLGTGAYRVKSVRLAVTISSDLVFTYDPTADSVRNFLPVGSPNYIADSDPGKPIELFGVGFRGIFQSQEFQENSPFPFGTMVKGTRNAYPAVFDEAGTPTDVSNCIVEQVDHVPFALGLTQAVAPGELVPSASTFWFEVDVCDPTIRAYLARSLNAGRLYFLISTLQPGQGGSGGGGGVTYPDFVTKETFPALSPQLELVVSVGDPADINGDTVVDLGDFFEFFNAFDQTLPAADVNADCQIDLADFFDFLNAFDGN